MRIKLKKGKQKELLLLAKKNKSWKKLSLEIGLSYYYVTHDLIKEYRTLSEDNYLKLCKIACADYDQFIECKLDDQWGRSKGGKISSMFNLKEIDMPILSTDLAELCGIILGDGHLEYSQKSIKKRNYSLTITGHKIQDKHYLSIYIPNLISALFNYSFSLNESKDSNGLYIRVHGKRLIEFFGSLGLGYGNKMSNAQKIPNWILSNEDYLKACLRGLVDTDGSIHYIAKNNRNLRITFTSYIPNLLEDVRISFLKLGFHPSKIIKGNQIFLTRKEDIRLYLKTIRFSNKKHLNRLENFQNKALVE